MDTVAMVVPLAVQLPDSKDGVVVQSGADVPWEVLWGCFETVEVKVSWLTSLLGLPAMHCGWKCWGVVSEVRAA